MKTWTWHLLEPREEEMCLKSESKFGKSNQSGGYWIINRNYGREKWGYRRKHNIQKQHKICKDKNFKRYISVVCLEDFYLVNYLYPSLFFLFFRNYSRWQTYPIQFPLPIFTTTNLWYGLCLERVRSSK